MELIWCKVLGYEDLYEVSSTGLVRSLDRIVTEKNGKTRVHRGRLLTLKRVGKYLGVSLYRDAIEKRFYVHRLVAEAFIDKPMGKDFVNHKNFNRHDNSVENLEWVTAQENTQHSARAGRTKLPPVLKGEKSPVCRLDGSAVLRIRAEWQPGLGPSLGKKYGVSTRTIYDIVHGCTWSDECAVPPRAV